MQHFSGFEYLMIDVANSFGMDKELWDTRIQWVKDNMEHLESLTAKADDPALFVAGVKAIRQAQRGEPSGYASSLDATASGLQILACLTGDRKAAEHVNVVPNGKRNDFYQAAYDIFKETSDAAREIERKDLKQAVMTSFYSSEAVPKAVFGGGSLLAAFYQTIAAEAPGCWQLNTWFKDLWNPNATRYDWVMPDNFHAHFVVEDTQTDMVDFMGQAETVVQTIERPTEEGRALGANCTHSVDGFIAREMVQRCNFNPDTVKRVTDLMIHGGKPADTLGDHHSQLVKTLVLLAEQSGYMSVRILEHIFTHNIHLVPQEMLLDLVSSLPEKPFEVIVVHDCYRALPNNCNELRWQYIKCLSNLAKSKMLSFILTQIVGEECEFKKMDEDLWIDILDSEYALS